MFVYRPVTGGVVGPTFACIVGQQFLNLRKGDRFWYENGNHPGGFNQRQLQEIRKSSLSRIICDNLDDIGRLDILFPSNHNIHKSSYGLCFWDFSKIYQLKGLKPKNIGHTNFYECCDLTEKVYLMYLYTTRTFSPLEFYVTAALAFERSKLVTQPANMTKYLYNNCFL